MSTDELEIEAGISGEGQMFYKIIRSPYGDQGTTYVGELDFLRHTLLQLKYYLKTQKRTPQQLAHLKADIKGYEELIETGSEENASVFLRMKHEAMKGGLRFPNNLAIIQHMKNEGIWNIALQ